MDMERVPETTPAVNNSTLRSRLWREANREHRRQWDRDNYHNNESRRQYKIEYARQRRARLREEKLRIAALAAKPLADHAEVA
jgi:hypothetical protein